ncbi:LptA/OstA family protein [Chlorobium phaeobacteroides]|jgi:hypothetical protein|uniref:Organic solvent tolerance-like N-terminal domain-containing protein n=1 Tax=Chlorobium phaeobacteroides (strain DSM 266 / SMG 266 / 2430) TaxID=290317 RepID=A1BJG5_CHLPD|nr:LptA/OstA family protein [Chlorobium phaeobacteroides]ABL66542.1 conserved hypothetical protein [Chlorobium phaeobacteroides DSM 266]MBV5319678.1 hypothetical protein [Chlorobium phaeobacteroides]
MKKNISIALLTMALLVQAAILLTPHHNTLYAENKKIILRNADIIEGGQLDGASSPDKQFRSVIGNVIFEHNNMTLQCDRATEYPGENRITLTGNITITGNDLEIHADNGIYHPDTEIGELTGNVRGRMISSNHAAKAKKAILNNRTNQLWLYEDAIAWGADQQISGDIILVHLKETAKGGKRRIDEVQVHRNAFFAAKDTLSGTPQLFDQLSGKKMVIRMNDRSKISGVTVTDQAESLYHLYDENRQPSGINYSSGNIIRMLFRDGHLVRVNVTGNVEGKQYPVSYRGDTSLNLIGFAWREHENPFKNKKSLP